MTIRRKTFNDKKTNAWYKSSGVVCMAVICLYSMHASGASVVQREVAARPTAVSNRPNTSARMPTMATQIAETVTTTETTTNTDNTTSSELVDTSDTTEEEIVIENKSSQFSDVLGNASVSSQSDTSDTELAEMIRRQRAALDAESAVSTVTQSTQASLSTGQNACDVALRKCMQGKCGNDFSKCSSDTDTAWGNKMDSCRLDTECTGTEYSKFAPEIKADRDTNAQLALYNSILDCGNRYNDCIVTQCGTTFSKCLGKSAGDAAISACSTIATECKSQDSGLASRAMSLFATLRVDAEEQVKRDEERLYALRDKMAEQCNMLGAMFDERTFDCVYTVEFYAGDNNTLFASKKAYAGSSFDCTPNWFGIDITTFKENAYRTTRAQQSATSALLGSGLGVAAGAVTSGAIDRAIDRQKAENALDKAKEEYEENYGDGSKSTTTQTTVTTTKPTQNTSPNTPPQREQEQQKNNTITTDKEGRKTAQIGDTTVTTMPMTEAFKQVTGTKSFNEKAADYLNNNNSNGFASKLSQNINTDTK